MFDALGIFHRLPYPLKVVAASAHGLRLRFWRYGQESERLIQEATERESWSRAQWLDWREGRLRRVLSHAKERVPFYRNQSSEAGPAGGQGGPPRLQDWPLLTKQHVRQNNDRFVPEGFKRSRLYRGSTGGTTGTPLTVFASRGTLRNWYALTERRMRHWHGVSIRERWAILGGQVVTPATCQKPPFWVHNRSLNQLYLSTHHISPKTAAAYAEAIRAFRPAHMVVFPSSGHLLASYLDRQDLGASLRCIFSNAEPLEPHQRNSMESVFGCPVRNTYGLGEMVAQATECTEGRLHLWPEAGYWEVLALDRDEPVNPGEVGRLVSTGLLNFDMPLIRYETGDLVAIDDSWEQCPCGVNFPVITVLHGRTADHVTTRDGRSIFWLNPVFYGLPVREAQIIQESLDRLHVRITPDAGFDETAARKIEQRLRDRVGDMEFRLELLDVIPRGRNGKFRPVVSKLTRQPGPVREGRESDQ